MAKTIKEEQEFVRYLYSKHALELQTFVETKTDELQLKAMGTKAHFATGLLDFLLTGFSIGYQYGMTQKDIKIDFPEEETK